MVTYLPRSAWTSTSAAGATLTGSELVGVAVHWPGTTQAAIGDPGQAKIAERLRSYRNFHVNTRGWSDVGYTFAIDQAGRVWMLRSTVWKGNRVGAHCASSSNPRANHKYVGVLLVIGQSETPSAKMIAAFQDWYHNRFLPGWPGRRDVRPHKRVPGALTNCCGTRATALIDNGTFTAQPTEDDMPLTDAEWTKLGNLITTKVNAVLNTPVKRTWSNVETNVAPADGGRYAFFANTNADLAARRTAAVEALVAKLVADGANDLTADQVREIVENAVIKVDVTVQGEGVAPDAPA